MRRGNGTRTRGFSISGITGIVAAALAADSVVFAMRCAPATNRRRLYVERVRLQFTTLTAFATPVVAARRLGLYRGSTAALTDGAALTPVLKDGSTQDATDDLAVISDARISTTAALTPGTFVREANEIDQISLSHVGASGGQHNEVIEFPDPQQLLPGELLVVSNQVAMDAGGTFQLQVSVQGHIASAY